MCVVCCVWLGLGMDEFRFFEVNCGVLEGVVVFCGLIWECGILVIYG